ncbi:FAD-dependent pyridine nucleotide-disulfide oxidoreductase [Mycena floridula]|nr:FAD-dependent pyridine nucleotide-disulfide oxidoreductase [Mycena floridula]
MLSSTKLKILIVGTGWGGVYSALSAIRALENAGRTDVQVIVIAPEPTLVIRVRLYEADISSVTPSIAELLSVIGVQYISGYVVGIRTDSRQLQYTTAETEGTLHTLMYDRLILASGSQVVRPNIPGLHHFSFTIDNYQQAQKLERHLLSLPSRPESLARNTVVIGGAGFTGLEAATEMPARLRAIFGEKCNFRVIIVESNAFVGPAFGNGARGVVEKALKALGIVVYTGEKVASVECDAVTTSCGRRIDCSTLIWTGGTEASSLTQQIPGAQLDTIGRIYTNPYLQIDVAPDVFATGDTACAPTESLGSIASMSCQYATAMGKYSGHNAVQDLIGLPMLPFRPPVFATCVDLGSWGAVMLQGQEKEVILEGAEAKKIKQVINEDIIYPPSHKDRAEALRLANPLLTLRFMDDGSGNYVYE